MRGELGRENNDSCSIEEIDWEDICSGCGTQRSEWKGSEGKGYMKNERIYCCRNCAEDIECRCGMRM
jgi:hypothetical protein